jgi:acetolactate synthase-1/2/3 large subunit
MIGFSKSMRVADYIASALADHGIRHVFMITGGGAMHLNDAFGRERRLSYVCCHHEQACAIAAESYFRLSGRLAAVNVTTGPGGINALNGVFGAYVDSIGMVVVSGQVKRETLACNSHLPLRQLGDQEVNIIELVRPITKFAEMVQDPSQIRYVMEKAIYIARTGRPGPVWIDVPIDVQSTRIAFDALRCFDPAAEANGSGSYAVPAEAGRLSGDTLRPVIRNIVERLQASKRPAILAGTGVRLSGAHDAFIRMVDKLNIATTSGWNAQDVIWNGHPAYVGRPGTVGDRAGNFAVQNSDFLLILGCRLNIRQISYNWSSFARVAFKVMVDVDSAELKKPTLAIELPVHADLVEFLPEFDDALRGYQPPQAHRDYLQWCRARKDRYPVVLPSFWNTNKAINPYCFMSALFDEIDSNEVIVTGDGTAAVVSAQVADLKPGQRHYSNSGCASMGYDLPAAIGACHTGLVKRVVCLAGDGSAMMNLQELQTIAGQKLPVKIFILHNDGYHSIRQTQQAYFPDNVVGCGPESGVTFPDFVRVAEAFGIPARRCASHGEMNAAIHETLNGTGPQLCEIVLDKTQAFEPKLASRKLEDGSMVSSPLEDLYPFLSRDELAANLLIPPQRE